MPRYGMTIDLKRCVGCNGCTIACKAENGTPKAVFYTKVLEQMRGKFPLTQRMYYPVLCNHCQEAPCQEACPTGATYTRADGIVLVEHDKCMGCRACYVACPYKNRYHLPKGILSQGFYGELTPFEKEKYQDFQEGTSVKCKFCVQRVEQGLEPACVTTCMAGARVFGDLEDPGSEVSRLIRQRNGFQPLAEHNTNPSVFYLD